MPSKDKRLGSRTACKNHCDVGSVARQRLNCRSAVLLATTALVAVTAFAPGAARAQDATWLSTPASNDFNTGTNWFPPVAPGGTAFFGMSNTTALMFSADTTIGGWTFNVGAPAYTFTNDHNLAFTGPGIIGGAPTITNNSIMSFDNTSTAGSASINNNLFLNFFDGSTAGSAIINNSGTVSFFWRH